MIPEQKMDEMRLRARLQILELRREFKRARMRGRDAELFEAGNGEGAEGEERRGMDTPEEDGSFGPLS